MDIEYISIHTSNSGVVSDSYSTFVVIGYHGDFSCASCTMPLKVALRKWLITCIFYDPWRRTTNKTQFTHWALFIKKKFVNRFIEPLRFWSGYNFLLLIFRKSPVSKNNTVLRPRIWIATLDLSTNILLHKCFWWVIIWYQDKDIWIFWMSPFKKNKNKISRCRNTPEKPLIVSVMMKRDTF